jgi:DNA repair exonuclease SbcCD ATPase subunit
MILFKKVRFKNFGSFGNTFTEIILDTKPTTLVCGTNGNGKSFALLDSITFALFGKPFRKINIPQLQNSINKKDCLVELEFYIGKTKYLLRRGLNPKIFEIFQDDVLLNQSSKTKDYQRHLEEDILKMTFKSFTQVVILGSTSFIPFMQLTAADRRAVIEDILDIGIFSEMNVVLKEKISQMKTRSQTLESKLEVLTEKERVVKGYISNLEKMKKETDDEIEEKQNKLKLDLKNLEAEKQSHEIKLTELEDCLKDIGSLQKNISSLNNIESRLEENLNKVSEEISFYEKNDVCSTCQQAISENVKHKCISDKSEKIKEIKLGIEKAKLSIKKYSDEFEEEQEKIKKVNGLKLKISTLEDRIDNIQKDLNKLNSPAKTSTGDIEIEKQNLLKISNDRNKIKTEMTKMSEDEEYMNVIGSLLKDSGIKAKIIKHYLPIINKLINKYLSSMDFFVKFNLDEEFNETIKSRHRDDFSYASFSEGEKMRIDLSLLLCWREIARMKNSVSCNLLILDEVFDSSLDSGGTEEFMKLLQALGKNSNIFVISHKTDQLIDKFSSIISFEKKNNFSKVVVN